MVRSARGTAPIPRHPQLGEIRAEPHPPHRHPGSVLEKVAEIGHERGEVDFLEVLALVEVAVDQCQGIDAHLQIGECLLELVAARQPGIQIEQACHDLQVVLHPMVNLPQHQLLLRQGLPEVGLTQFDLGRHGTEVVAELAHLDRGAAQLGLGREVAERHRSRRFRQLLRPSRHQEPRPDECGEHAGNRYQGENRDLDRQVTLQRPDDLIPWQPEHHVEAVLPDRVHGEDPEIAVPAGSLKLPLAPGNHPLHHGIDRGAVIDPGRWMLRDQHLSIPVEQVDLAVRRQAGLLADRRQPVQANPQRDDADQLPVHIVHRSGEDDNRLVQGAGHDDSADVVRLGADDGPEPVPERDIVSLAVLVPPAQRLSIDVEQNGGSIGGVWLDGAEQDMVAVGLRGGAVVAVQHGGNGGIVHQVRRNLLGLPEKVRFIVRRQGRIAADRLAGGYKLVVVALDGGHDAEAARHHQHDGKEQDEPATKRLKKARDHSGHVPLSDLPCNG